MSGPFWDHASFHGQLGCRPVAWFLVAAPSNIAWKWIQLMTGKKKTEISQLGTTTDIELSWVFLHLYFQRFTGISLDLQQFGPVMTSVSIPKNKEICINGCQRQKSW